MGAPMEIFMFKNSYKNSNYLLGASIGGPFFRLNITDNTLSKVRNCTGNHREGPSGSPEIWATGAFYYN